MKEKFFKMFLSLLIIALIIFEFFIVSKVSASTSNTLISWGFQRVENNAQPNLDINSKNILEKHNGFAIGNETDPYIYLTFDLGYEAGYTSKILDVLKENNVTAAFFVTAHYLNTQEALVKRMLDEGHIVGNHTVNHKELVKLSDEEIKEEITNLSNSIYDKFGYEMTFFRPPKGEYSERVVKIASELNYTTVLWSSAYDDWDESKQGREEYGKSKILDNLHNGCILLLHATSKDNMNILNDVITQTKNKGYEFKSLNDIKLKRDS